MSISADKLSPSDIQARLESLEGWTQKGETIVKTYKFGDFPEAFAWMTRCAFEAETLQHHPDWSNVYNTVEVALSTHDVGGLTARDFALAERMDRHAK